jgi:transcription antitermination factor NusG
MKKYELDIESFLPTKNMLSACKDRKKHITIPLFPSYVFVNLQNLMQYYEGLSIPGTLYFVRIGKQLARVNPSIINSIRSITGCDQDVDSSSQYFQPGKQILIKDGPLKGLAGEVIPLNGAKRVLIRVELLRRNLLVTLPNAYILCAV